MKRSTRSLTVSSDVSGLRPRTGNPARPIPHPLAHLLTVPVLAALTCLFPVAPAIAQSDSPFFTLPRFGGGDQPDLFLYFDHTSGSGYLLEGLRREPVQLRGGRLADNLFQLIGRASNQPAIHGELLLLPIFSSSNSVRDALLVETSTGYVAYLDEFAKNGKLGSLVTVIGRPFGPLAAGDGNFALLQRRDSSGKTDGAYLYHGTTGNAIYIGGLAKLSTDLKGLSTVALPKFESRFGAAEILSGGGTASYLLVDANSGKVTFLDLVPGAPERMVVRPTGLDLLTAFAADKLNPSLQRFVVEPLQENGTTRSILVIDVASGQLGLIDEPLGQPRLRILPQSVYNVLRPAAGEVPRTFATVRNGLDGVWLLDSLSAGLIYISNPLVPAEMRIQTVGIER